MNSLELEEEDPYYQDLGEETTEDEAEDPKMQLIGNLGSDYIKTLMLQAFSAVLAYLILTTTYTYAVKPIISMVITLMVLMIPILITIMGPGITDQIVRVIGGVARFIHLIYTTCQQPPAVRKLIAATNQSRRETSNVWTHWTRIKNWFTAKSMVVKKQKKLKNKNQQKHAEIIAKEHITREGEYKKDKILYLPSKAKGIHKDPNTREQLLVNARIMDVISMAIQLDTGSQLSLINEKFFKKIEKLYPGKIKHLKKEDLVIKGIG